MLFSKPDQSAEKHATPVPEDIARGICGRSFSGEQAFSRGQGRSNGQSFLAAGQQRAFDLSCGIGMTLSRPRYPDKLGTPAKAREQQEGLVERVEGGDEKGATAQVIALCRAIRGTPEKHVIPKELRDSHDIGAPSDPDETINPGEYRAL